MKANAEVSRIPRFHPQQSSLFPKNEKDYGRKGRRRHGEIRRVRQCDEPSGSFSFVAKQPRDRYNQLLDHSLRLQADQSRMTGHPLLARASLSFPFFSCNGELHDVIVRRHFRSACQKACTGASTDYCRVRILREECPKSERLEETYCIPPPS